MVEELIDFALTRYPSWWFIDREKLREFFEQYKETILVRCEGNQITGFCVYAINENNRPSFLAIAGIGGRWENFRIMRHFLTTKFLGKVFFAKDNKRIRKCLPLL